MLKVNQFLGASFIAPSQQCSHKIKVPGWIDFCNDMCCPDLQINLKLGDTHAFWKRNRTFNLIWVLIPPCLIVGVFLSKLQVDVTRLEIHGTLPSTQSTSPCDSMWHART